MFRYAVETERRFYLANEVVRHGHRRLGAAGDRGGVERRMGVGHVPQDPLRPEGAGADVQGRQRGGAAAGRALTPGARRAAGSARTRQRAGTGAHGYEVLARNWRCPHGEIDLVAGRAGRGGVLRGEGAGQGDGLRRSAGRGGLAQATSSAPPRASSGWREHRPRCGGRAVRRRGGGRGEDRSDHRRVLTARTMRRCSCRELTSSSPVRHVGSAQRWPSRSPRPARGCRWPPGPPTAWPRWPTATNGTAFRVDLLDPVAAEALMARVEADAGPVDVLVNNAGLESSRLLRYEEISRHPRRRHGSTSRCRWCSAAPCCRGCWPAARATSCTSRRWRGRRLSRDVGLQRHQGRAHQLRRVGADGAARHTGERHAGRCRPDRHRDVGPPRGARQLRPDPATAAPAPADPEEVAGTPRPPHGRRGAARPPPRAGAAPPVAHATGSARAHVGSPNWR